MCLNVSLLLVRWIDGAYTFPATFYLWLDLSSLPKTINDGLNFFAALLEEKAIVVPGIFFDLNPSKRRDLYNSPVSPVQIPQSS
jgi:aspartate/methionine/tyrosine aminotransferase